MSIISFFYDTNRPNKNMRLYDDALTNTSGILMYEANEIPDENDYNLLEGGEFLYGLWGQEDDPEDEFIPMHGTVSVASEDSTEARSPFAPPYSQHLRPDFTMQPGVFVRIPNSSTRAFPGRI